MNVLVTGGLGFIGSHTCVELLNANYDVVIITSYEYYVVDQYLDSELNEFLSLIDYDNLFFSWKYK